MRRAARSFADWYQETRRGPQGPLWACMALFALIEIALAVAPAIYAALVAALVLGR